LAGEISCQLLRIDWLCKLDDAVRGELPQIPFTSCVHVFAHVFPLLRHTCCGVRVCVRACGKRASVRAYVRQTSCCDASNSNHGSVPINLGAKACI